MNKTVFLAGIIGLFFGFMFSATLGVSFFDEDTTSPTTNPTPTNTETLRKDSEAFKTAYNLTESIYMPITGEQAYQMIEDNETFILYAGRETCPYCQQFVPVLMEAAQNQDIEVIYYIDTTDPLNKDFVDDFNINVTPTTFVYKNGMLQTTEYGYKTLTDTESFLSNTIN